MSATHVFNQYYFDFLKKLKDIAKNKKDEDANARILRKSIKKHYASYDRLSDEYRIKFQEYVHGWKEYEPTDAWMDSEHIRTAMVYEGVTVDNLVKLTGDVHTIGYFITMLVVFSKSLNEEEVSGILKFLKDKDSVEFTHEDGMVQSLVLRLKSISQSRNEKVKNAAIDNEAFKAMENTSLGKLAREILDEVNISEIQDSLGDGDILKSLTNPNSGITKLLGTVSQKMLSKMANGEIKHEALLQDAMKLASSIPGMGDLGAIGNIMKNFTGGDGDGNGMPDLGGLMKSLGLGGAKPPRAAGSGNNAKYNTTAVNQHMRRTVQANQMRRKLEKRRKENVQGQVEDERKDLV